MYIQVGISDKRHFVSSEVPNLQQISDSRRELKLEPRPGSSTFVLIQYIPLRGYPNDAALL